MASPDIYSSRSFDDIVFESRNKQYGSYILRRIIPKHTWVSLGITSGSVVVFIGILFTDFSFLRRTEELIPLPVEITLSDPPPILEAMPPAVPPAAEKMATSELVEMEVKQDNQVNDPEKIRNDEKVDSTANGTQKNGSDKSSTQSGNGSTVYVSVEEMPVYPGGKIGLTKYLKENLEYPKEAKENGIQGTVIVFFVVNEDGSVSDVKLKKGIGGGCDKEAIRIVQEMRKWKPGKQGGVPVKVYQQLPIVFKLQGE